MLPFRDENPTVYRGLMTYVIIAINVVMFVFYTPSPDTTVVEQINFSLQNAAIPCEITEGRPLTVEEVDATFSGSSSNRNACDLNGDLPDEPYARNKIVWASLITSMFLHGGWMHLIGNMWFLFIFGNNIEDRMGSIRYLLYYLIGGIVAALAQVWSDPTSTVPIVGASGAVAAVMGTYLAWYPDAPIRTLLVIFVRDIRAKWWLGFWFITQFFTSPDAGIAWVAHAGGFAAGVAYGLAIRASKPLQRVTFRPPYDEVRHWDNTGGVGVGPYPQSRPVTQRRLQ